MPRSLQALLQATEYPPETPTLMQHESAKVIMIVNTVSPTPFALLRRAKHFDYHDDDRALQAFAAFEDPVQALTEECRRVLRCISSTNQSPADAASTLTGHRDGEWSRFEDLGFSSLIDDRAGARSEQSSPWSNGRPSMPSLSSAPQSRTQDQGRPTTPSWADFLSAGFADGSGSPPGQGARPLLLPPDKVLPPIAASRTHSSPSGGLVGDDDLEPGELASITVINLDASFWWVWMTSLAGEEPPARKAVFGRCAVLETGITGGRWLVMEEKVKGAASVPVEGAHIVEKKSRFGLTKRGRGISWRGKSAAKSPPPPLPSSASAQTPYSAQRPTPLSKTSIGPDSHARIQAAARALQQKEQRSPGVGSNGHPPAARRARTEDVLSTKTNSMFTLQPVIMREAAPAMKWANKFDKDNIRETYLATDGAGRGHQSSATLPPHAMLRANGESSSEAQPPAGPGREMSTDRELPALPREASSHGIPPPPPPDQKLLPTDMKVPPPPESPAVPSPGVHGTAPWAASRTTLQGSEFPSPAELDPVPPPYSREQSPPPHSPATASPPVPAMRNESVDSTQQPTAEITPDATPAPEPVPVVESIPDRTLANKRDAKRLQKKGGGGGGGAFKKFFGRKSPEPQQPAEPRTSLSPHDHQGFEHSRPGLGRRLSSLQRSRSPKPSKTVPDAEPTASATELGVPSGRGTPMASRVSVAEPQPAPERTETPEPQPVRRRMVLSNPDPNTTADAILAQSIHHTQPTAAIPDVPRPMPASHSERPVSPLEPVESATDTPADETVSEPSIETPPLAVPVAPAAPAPLVARKATAAPVAPIASMAPVESAAPAPVVSPAVTPPPDRWAQIRKNAAERAAARKSVEPGRLASPGRTEEGGDTSGSGDESKCLKSSYPLYLKDRDADYISSH